MNEFLTTDFETGSDVDLKKAGVDVYARHPSTRVLMLGYALDDHAPGLWEPHKTMGAVPERLLKKLLDPNVMIIAHNAVFERMIFKHVLGIDIPIERFICTQGMALSLSLPAALGQLTHDALQLAPEFCKSKEGDKLIHFFCKPQKRRRKRGETVDAATFWNDWSTHPDKWKEFGVYCVQDVVSERKVYCVLRKYMTNFEDHQALYAIDQRINEHGLPVDDAMIHGARIIMKKANEVAKAALREITIKYPTPQYPNGISNPNSSPQALAWLVDHGYPFASLKKDRVKLALKDFTDELADTVLDEGAIEFLKLRLLTNKASVKKFNALKNASFEGWLRFMFQFCGAGRTNRWAGRVVQLQNLARPHSEVEKLLDEVRQIIRDGDYETLVEFFKSPLDVLGSSVRSAICAPAGFEFKVADLASIELCVSAWHTKCKFWLEVLRQKKDPYCAFGEHFYEVPYEELMHEFKVLKKKKRRNGAKPAALGAQYRLGGGDIVGDYPDQEKTGLWGYAQGMGVELTKEESHRAVKVYRDLSPEIVQEWYDLENAAAECIDTREPQTTRSGVRFDMKPPFLRMRLASGRYMFYCQPKMQMRKIKGKDGEEYEKRSITYMGVHQKNKKWVRLDSHGGKLFENLVQALARDILVHGMKKAIEFGFNLIGHVHDELIALTPVNDPKYTDHALAECMSDIAPWMKGLPLGAEGYASEFYRKEAP